MGYSHYYEVVDYKTWESVLPVLVSEAQLMVTAADILVTLTYHGSQILHADAVEMGGFTINGLNHENHEPFITPPPVYRPEYGKYIWTSTKTRRKPYDLTVCLVLLRMKKLAGEGLCLRSDGSWNREWCRSRKIYDLLWPGEKFDCPWAEETENTPAMLGPPSLVLSIKLKEPLADHIAAGRLDASMKRFQEYGNEMKKALSGCLTNPTEHNSCVSNTNPVEPCPGVKFRLIDTFQNCIIEEPTTQHYVALSYVWGNSNQLQLTTENYRQLLMPGGLSITMLQPAQTILEAAALCKLLGQRYLWADAICIKQDDTRDRTIQILRMRQIYSNAAVTIVAACGQDADGSLEIRNHLENTNVSLNNLCMGSIWCTRAWTYQEDALSHRQLIFSPSGLYFKCQKSVIRICQNSIARVFGPTNDTTFIAAVSLPGNELQTFYRVVTEYSTRKLRFSSDRINAFQGILKHFCHQLDGIPNSFHYGLPTSAFDQAFCWQIESHHPSLRRPEWPSWSWLGWNQSVFWEFQHQHRPNDQRTAQMLWPQSRGQN